MTPRRRVLVLVDDVSDGAGGAEGLAVGLAAGLPSGRYDVSLCATHGIAGALEADLDTAGVRHFALGRGAGRADPRRLARLARYLRSERIEVLHAHKFGSNLWGALIGAACRVPVVIAHEHTWSYEGRPLRRFLDGYVIGRLVDCFVAVSNMDRGRMIEIEHVPPAKIRVLPTALIPRAAQARADLRSELGIEPGAQVVGTVARLRPQKALTVLLDAFVRLAEQRPGIHLVIVGDGECLPELRAAAAASGFGGRVHFPGLRTDIESVLGAYDVAVMSSDFEGLPLFVFECMAARTPLVATAVGGLPDVIADEVTGLLVPPRDAASLAGALERLLERPELGERLAAAAHERLAEFTMERAVERFSALYDELLAS